MVPVSDQVNKYLIDSRYLEKVNLNNWSPSQSFLLPISFYAKPTNIIVSQVTNNFASRKSNIHVHTSLMHIHIFHNMFVEFKKSFNMTDKHVYITSFIPPHSS